jgi:hypothetical protein
MCGRVVGSVDPVHQADFFRPVYSTRSVGKGYYLRTQIIARVIASYLTADHLCAYAYALQRAPVVLIAHFRDITILQYTEGSD